MRKLKLFFACLLMAVLSIGQVWATPLTATFNWASGGNMTAATGTQGQITLTGAANDASGAPAVTSNTLRIYAYRSNGNGSSATFTAAEGYQILSFTVNVSQNGKEMKYAVDGGTTYTAFSYTNNSATVDNLTASSFTLKNCQNSGSSNNTIRLVSVVISYESTSSCSNTVAITKGAETNGSYTLSATEVCGDGDGGTIEISDITPATGYVFDEITTSASGTVDNELKKVTGITAATTITCKFKSLPKYKVSFNVGGSTASQADITEASAGAGIELPVGPTPTCSADGWVFAGWKETSAVDVETTAAPTLLLAGANYKPAANCTLYAVYKRTESGAVTDQDVTETFENQDAGTDYQKTLQYSAANSNAGIAWEMYYGTVSTNDKIAGDKSAQMRWYSSATSNIPYIKTTNTVSGLQSVNFKARVSNTAVKMSLWYSTDGTNWTISDVNQETFTATGTAYDFSATISGTVGTNYYIKIGEDGGTAPSSGNYKLIIDAVQFNYKAGASTTYYLSAPTCGCSQLDAPTVSVPDGTLTYNGAKLTWGSVADADKYKVYIYNADKTAEIEHDDAVEGTEYTIAATLTATTTYKYSVQAISDTPEEHCASELTEGSFTTKSAPAATLTLSEIGETHNFDGDHTVGETVTLPLSATECSKTFVGWDADADCNHAPTYAPGASYTLTATTQTLYAVYANPVGAVTYVKTALASIPSGSEVVVTELYSEKIYAAANDGGTSAGPAAVEVTETTNVLNVGSNTNIFWILTKDGDNFSLTVKGGTDKLYCTDTNDGVRVGSGENNVFSINNAYLYNNATSRYIGKNHGSGAQTFRCYTSINTNINGETLAFYKKNVNYEDYSTTCAAALAAPTFSVDPADGPFTSAQSVELSATEGTIYYNINSADDPTSASTPYTGAIDVDACGSTTIKAIAISSTNQSLVASATYVLNLPIPSVSAEDPYTEAEAIAVYDGGCYNNEDVWVTGTVQTAQFYNNSKTYTITLTNGFQFYYFYESFDGENLVPFENDYIVEGDVLVAKGKLGKHNTTYQIADGYLVSRTPASKTPIDSDIDNPITVAAALNYIDNAATYDLSEDEYVAGIVESIAECPQHEGTYDIIVLDATDNTKQIKFFGCDVKTFAGIKQYDQITGKGKLFKYYSTYELNYPCEVVALTPYVAPVVDVTGVEVDETATVKVGKTVQLTANVLPANATNQSVTWTILSGNDKINLSNEGVVTGVKEGESIVQVEAEDGGFTATCTITVEAGTNFNNGVWQLVTDASTLSVNDHLVIVSNATGKEAVAGDISSQIMASVDVAFSVDKKYLQSLPSDAVILTLGGTSGAWTLANEDDELLGATAAKKLAWDGGTTTWSISIADNNATIQNGENGYGRFLYNSNSGQERFTTYTSDPSASMLLPQLYRFTTTLEDYTRPVTNGNFGTICLPYAGTISGATLFELSGKDADHVYVDELGTSLEAGKPYVFLASADQITVTYNAFVYTEPSASGYKGLHGTFVDLSGNDLIGTYLISNNKYYNIDTDNCSLNAYRAYFMYDEIDQINNNQMPVRRRFALGNGAPQVATGVDTLNASETPVKMIINGQLYILRGEKLFDATGRLVK